MVNPKSHSQTQDDRTVTVDLDVFTKVSGLVVDLDPVVQELFESSTVENTISGRTGIIDNELVLSGGDFGSLWLKR
jgi:hypothetical protein